jgi:Ca2+-binding EF-hand superfamily protein
MRVRNLILLSVSLTLLAACGHRKPARWNPNGDPVRNENYHGGPNAMLLRYDTNHDGTLTRAELEAGLHADFDALDVAHTGCLTNEEVQAVNQQRIKADQASASPLMDWNGDGCVDFNEFSVTTRSLFDSLDRNNDGKITPLEFNPRRKTTRDDDDPRSRGGGY